MNIVCLECGTEFGSPGGEVCPNAPHPVKGEKGYVLPMYDPKWVDPATKKAKKRTTKPK